MKESNFNEDNEFDFDERRFEYKNEAAKYKGWLKNLFVIGKPITN
jgi:hypothetical protein